MGEKQAVTQLNIRIPHPLAQALEELASAEHIEKLILLDKFYGMG